MKNERCSLAILFLLTLGLSALPPWTGRAGEYQSDGTPYGYDCHTMLFTQSRNQSNGMAVALAHAQGRDCTLNSRV